ncbi:MAG TPA: hypothetical protein VFX16_35675 [Pseudonocardiaceae bacterium]|nr:hypothetical protein [Pseudonocardiaceae bacterium]
MWRRLVIALTAIAVGVTACTSGQSTTPVGCVISPVHRSHVPAGVGGFSPGSVGIPWIGDDRFVAVLFYARGGNPDIPAHGGWSDGGSAKILWWAEGAAAQLAVHGRESGGREFTQSFQTIGNGQYPTVVAVPEPGCWTLDAAVGSRHVGSITVRAVQR